MTTSVSNWFDLADLVPAYERRTAGRPGQWSRGAIGELVCQPAMRCRDTST